MRIITLAYLLLLSFLAFTQPTNSLHIKGLQTLDVLRDKWEINHIYASNQHDLFFVRDIVCSQRQIISI